MSTQLKPYRHKKTGKIVHAKPALSQPNVMLYYNDRNGKPTGQVLGTTVEKFNDRYERITNKEAAIAQKI